MKRPTGLGRGLSALIDDSRTGHGHGDGGQGVREIDIGRIKPGSGQPRKHFDPHSIAELAKSIGERGVLQPILLRPVGDEFEIIAGERRWRAAQQAQLHRIPAIIRELDDSATAEVALIENIQREDLSAIEEAEGFKQLIERYGHSQEAVGKLVGKSRSHVTNLIRLLDLPEDVRNMLLRGDITMGHARAVLTAPDPLALADEIIAEGLSVRQAEARARENRSPAPSKGKAATASIGPANADIAELERQLGDLLGLRVKVTHGKSGGQVALTYSTLDQLDMICQRLSGEPI